MSKYPPTKASNLFSCALRHFVLTHRLKWSFLMIVGGFELLVIATVLPDNREEMLLNGEVDCLVACYSKTDTRLENFDFSPIYYTDVTPVMVENSSRITDINQLKDGTFGIMSGSNAGPLLTIKLFDMGIIGEEVISNTDESTEYDHATVIKYPSYEDLSIALEEGRVDAAVMDGAFVDTYINDDRSLLEDFSVSDQDYAVATQKGSNLSQPDNHGRHIVYYARQYFS